ncbi:hypothetical protein BASA62_000790 [Batrachochytrium salamandrivorans]|nr:hypothetical protein BASA62_000790 [Batrachochytrium salamandrivorans]
MTRSGTQAIAAATPRRRNRRMGALFRVGLGRGARPGRPRKDSHLTLDHGQPILGSQSDGGAHGRSLSTKDMQELAITDDICTLVSAFSKRQSKLLVDFREEWLALGFSRVHSIDSSSESYETLMSCFYGALLELLDADLSQFKVAAISFALYALYFSRPLNKPVALIRLSPRQLKLVLAAQRSCSENNIPEAAAAITHLLESDAFMIVPYDIKVCGPLLSYSKSPISKQNTREIPVAPHTLCIRELVQDAFIKKSKILPNLDDWNVYDQLMRRYVDLKGSLDHSILSQIPYEEDCPQSHDFHAYGDANTEVLSSRVAPDFADIVKHDVESYEDIKRQRIEILTAMAPGSISDRGSLPRYSGNSGIDLLSLLLDGDLVPPELPMPFGAHSLIDGVPGHPIHSHTMSQQNGTGFEALWNGIDDMSNDLDHNTILENLLAGLAHADHEENDLSRLNYAGGASVLNSYSYLPSDMGFSDTSSECDN